MKVLQFPLARITLFFVIGIIAAYYMKPGFTAALWAALTGLLACVVLWFQSRKQLVRKIHLGISLYYVSFLTGMITYTAHNGYIPKNHYTHQLAQAAEIHTLKLVIREKLRNTIYKTRYVAEVTGIDSKPSTGLILLNIDSEKSGGKDMPDGTVILTQGQVLKHKPPYNPEQFDYGKYLSGKSIAAQAYVKPENITVTDTLKSPAYYASAFRNRIVENLGKSHFRKEELAVVTALILGQQQDISKETILHYQYAGAVHILSVSGLHVGYIMLFVNFLLLRLPKNRKGNTFRLICILGALWAFSFIAGLSPSIVRSATMFSFVTVGMYLKRETYIFHTLLVSLLLIMMVCPSFLFDVGFQLSYVSLFFILWLQPFFSGFWQPKSKIVKYFWDVFTVSLAAQVGAFPLSIYYFHQFPGLFFITNMVILPALGIIMGFGLLVMIAASFGFAPAYLTKPLEFLIWLLNEVIGKIASIEQFVLKDIPMTMLMAIGLYAFLVALFLWLMKPAYGKLVSTIAFLLIFQGIFIITRWENSKTEEMMVFRSKNSSLMAERHGENITVYCNDSIGKNIMQNPALTPYRVANFSTVSDIRSVPCCLFFKGRRLYLVDSSGVYPKNISPDIILMSRSPKINFERMLNQLKPTLVVADASNFRTYVKQWESTCRKQKIPFHAIAEKGYFKLE